MRTGSNIENRMANWMRLTVLQDTTWNGSNTEIILYSIPLQNPPISPIRWISVLISHWSSIVGVSNFWTISYTRGFCNGILMNIFTLGLPPRDKPSTSLTAEDRSGVSRLPKPAGRHDHKSPSNPSGSGVRCTEERHIHRKNQRAASSGEWTHLGR